MNFNLQQNKIRHNRMREKPGLINRSGAIFCFRFGKVNELSIVDRGPDDRSKIHGRTLVAAHVRSL